MVRQKFCTTWLRTSEKPKVINDSQHFEHVSTNTWQTSYYNFLPMYDDQLPRKEQQSGAPWAATCLSCTQQTSYNML